MHTSHHRLKKRMLLLALAALLVYAAVTVLIVVGRVQEEKNSREAETFGSLDGRFSSRVTAEWNGRQWDYRDNELETVLLIGTDTEALENGSGTYRSEVQADSLILLVIDRAEKRITPLQIDRDTVTEVEIYSILGRLAGKRQTQLCLAQGFGNSTASCSLNTARAVSNMLLGVPVDHYVTFDLRFIDRFNDALGGVTVRVEDDLSAVDPKMVPGAVITLHGSQAQAFVRSRMGVADGTNANRMGRQRAFLKEAVDILHASMEADPRFAEKLLSALEGTYDSNLAATGLLGLVNRYGKYTVAPFLTPEGEYVIGQDGFREFHADRHALADQVTRLCFR